MANSTTRNLVRKVVTKQEDGTLSNDYVIGAIFDDIVDGERAGATGYTLSQFIDNYMNFMSNVPFIYVGANEPTNTHIGLWIDTGHTQN